jgi:hypothetical protein
MVRISLYPFAAQTKARAMPVLDRSQGIEELALQGDRRPKPLGDAIEFDEGSVSDGFDDVIVDFSVCHGLRG